MSRIQAVPKPPNGVLYQNTATNRSRILKLVTATVGTTFLAIIAISTLAADILTTPQRHPLYAGKTPGALGVAYEDVRLPARGDGVGISAWFMPSGQNCKVIVLVHGKDANRTREFDTDLSDNLPGQFPELAVELNRRGFAVLMIDLRGHGESESARFGFGRTERLDVLGAVDWLVARGFRPGAIGVLGVSMGAATTIGAASIDQRIGAIVADSSFAELAPLVEQSWTTVSHLPKFILPMTTWIAKNCFGSDIEAARPLDEIGAIRRPILLIHGDADPIIPAEHARKLKQAGGDLVQLWESQSDRHAAIYNIYKQVYIETVHRFFASHLE